MPLLTKKKVVRFVCCFVGAVVGDVAHCRLSDIIVRIHVRLVRFVEHAPDDNRSM